MQRSEIVAALRTIADHLTTQEGDRERHVSAAALMVGELMARLASVEARDIPPVRSRTDVRTRILDALSSAWPDGINLYQIRRKELGGHVRSGIVLPILKEMEESGVVRVERRERPEGSPGRPATVYILSKAPGR